MESTSGKCFLNYCTAYFDFLCIHYSSSVDSLSCFLLRLVSAAKNVEHLKNTKGSSSNDPLLINVPAVKPPLHSTALTFFYSNVRSLLPKVDYFRNYVSVYEPSVIGVTESWLSRDVPSSLFCPTNYNIYRKDRLYAKGGGSLILVRNDTVSHSVPLPISDSCKIDAVACRIALQQGEALGVLCVYRPPNITDDENAGLLAIMTAFLSNDFQSCIILGDFNFPDIQWPCSASCGQSEQFLHFVQDYFLQQHVLLPTRRSSNSVLDLVLSTPGCRIFDLSVNEEFSNSDHSIIQFSLGSSRNNDVKTVLRRNLRNADWRTFRNELSVSLANWHSYLDSRDVDAVWRQLLLVINEALDKVAPTRPFSKRYFASSPLVRTALRHKRRLFRAYVNSPCLANLIAYTKSLEIAKNVIANDTFTRENRVIDSADQRLFWSYVNRHLSNDHVINSLNSNGALIKEQVDISQTCRFNVEYVISFESYIF